jgi:hypothetical protein
MRRTSEAGAGDGVGSSSTAAAVLIESSLARASYPSAARRRRDRGAHADAVALAQIAELLVALGDEVKHLRLHRGALRLPARGLGLAAGIKAHVAGENVATAGTLENAHRALWASPSHRGNLLFDRFTKVGVAVIRAADGMVWVTEMFSG